MKRNIQYGNVLELLAAAMTEEEKITRAKLLDDMDMADILVIAHFIENQSSELCKL